MTGCEVAPEQLKPAVKTARDRIFAKIATRERLTFGEPIAVPKPVGSMAEDGRHTF